MIITILITNEQNPNQVSALYISSDLILTTAQGGSY